MKLKVPLLTKELSAEAPNSETAPIEDKIAFAKKVLATIKVTGKSPKIADMTPEYDAEDLKWRKS